MNSLKPRVFVIDDEPSVGKSLERLLRAGGMAVSCCESAHEYLAQYDPELPGCLVLDLSMPGLSGLDLQQTLAARASAPPIVFLTGHGDVPSSVQAMKRGAVDFLSKPVDEAVLVEAVSSAIEKDRVERRDRAGVAAIRARLATLTPREAEVLPYVIAGLLNKQTADRLGAAEKTIKVHRAHIMEKMQVRSVAELVRLAASAGITPADER
jgi:FixJ family two-component response regulator